MANTLLRSGDIKDFQALGQDGKAVYLFATQIRDTFRMRLGQQYANHLAIPQRNDQGNIIDWYIPFTSDNPNGEYDIVPWTSANEQEKNAALIKLQEFEQKVIELGKNMTSNANLSGDQLLFSRLVYNPQASLNDDEREKVIAIRFPTEDFVYIVNGIPVITFWGFLSQQQQITGSAFRCLNPLKTAVTRPSAPTPPPEEPVKRKSWWRWLWLLLPLLLLLLLLLFLLRGCNDKIGNINIPTISVPDITHDGVVTPEVDVPSQDGNTIAGVTPDLPTVNVNTIPRTNGTMNIDPLNPDVTVPLVDDDGVLVNADTGLDLPVSDVPVTDTPVTDIPATDTPTTDLPSTDNSASDPLNQNIPILDDNDSNNNGLNADGSSNTDSNLPNGNGSQAVNPTADDSTTNNPAANNSTANNRLTLPTNALKEGSTDFLNGKWNVSSGIQDKKTGKPLRLEYNFDKGNGTVTVTNSDGLKCVGNVSSGASQGNLNINNQTHAICSDNSSYLLPKIKCTPGQNNVANCQGDYGDGTKFPITIKQ